MKRKFLALLCIVALMAVSLAACVVNKGNEPSGDVCEHTYSESWSTNSAEHWHAATCEHAELKSAVATHTDADQNGKCDVCDYEIGHEHTFESKWTTNDTHHWKVATCSHTEEKGELGAHTDSDSDGACDACSKHVHVINLYGKCTVCGEDVVEVDITDINVVLPIVLSNAGKVVGGDIAYENICTDVGFETVWNDETEQDELVTVYTKVVSKQTVLFLLGKNAAYYNIKSTADYGYGEYEDVLESWFELLEDGTAFGVSKYQGEGYDFEINSGATANDVAGFYFAVSTLADAYGAESLLEVLYSLSQSAAASNYNYTYDNGTYEFSFAYLSVNSDTGEGEGDHVDYYELKVSFTVSASGTLTSLNVDCDCYTNSLEDEEDNDYTYDQSTGTITMKDGAVADTYSFKITQREGAKTYTSEHPKSSFIPESFDAFVDEELTTQLGDTVTVTLGETAVIYFGNFLPAGSSAKYLADTFITTLDLESPVFAWCYDGTVSFYASELGSYDIEFTLGSETFSFTLVVEEGKSDVVEQPENSVFVEITKDDTYAWSAVATFTPTVDGDFTFYIPVGYGTWDKIACDNHFSGAPYTDLYNEEGGIFTVSLRAGETYEFYVSYTAVCTVYLTYTVDDYTGDYAVGGGDSGEAATGVVGGTYTGSNNYAGTSTLVIDTAESTVTMNGQTFTYTFEDGVFTVYMNGNAMSPYMVGVTLGSDGVPTAFVYNGSEYVVISGGSDDDDAPELTTVVEGTYIGTNSYVSGALTLVIDGNTVTFTYNDPFRGPSVLEATYAIVDGEVVLYNEDGTTLHPLAGGLTVDAYGNPTVAAYNGYDFDLVLDSSNEGGDEDDDDNNENNADLAVLEGQYEMDGYTVDIYQSYDGSFYFDVSGGFNMASYLFSAVDNGDGTFTLVLTETFWSEDAFGFLNEEFTATVDGDTVCVECSDVAHAFLYTGSKSPQHIHVDGDEALNHVKFKIDPNARYIRISIRDKEGRWADTRGFFPEEFRKQN